MSLAAARDQWGPTFFGRELMEREEGHFVRVVGYMLLRANAT